MPALTVLPGPPLAGRLAVPGDKSVTHRACLLALLAEGETVLEGWNQGEDCLATLRCLHALGGTARARDGALTFRGTAGELREPEDVLHCGNSATTLRLVAGLVAAHPLVAVLTGDASLRQRPVDRVVAPLRRMGALVRARAGDRLPPLVVRGGALRGVRYRLPVASAQVATCVLLAGLGARGATTVEVPGPARDHTERLLPIFGAAVDVQRRPDGGSRVTVEGPARLRGARLRVPGDLSAAAFFLASAASAPGAAVTATGVSLNPTRAGLLDVLEHMGAKVERVPRGEDAGEPSGDVTVTGPERLEAWDVPPSWFPRLLDEVPAWAVAASAAAGTSRLSGAGELRWKESDRLRGLVSGLRALGVAASEEGDGLAITGGPIRGGVVPAQQDHRLAMAFALLGQRAEHPVTVDEAETAATSFPGFVEALRSLGGRVAEPREGGGRA